METSLTVNQTPSQITNSINQVVAMDTPGALADLRMNPSIPHYKNVPRMQRLTWLMNKITSLNILKHQRIEDEFLKADAENLDECIMENMYISDFTFQEISEAFRNGLMGKYGEYYGLTSISLFGFLEQFFNSEKKRKAIRIVQARKMELRKKQLREQAMTIEKWGMKMHDVSADYLERKAQQMVDEKERERLNAEHREMVRKQAREILRQHEKETAVEKDY